MFELFNITSLAKDPEKISPQVLTKSSCQPKEKLHITYVMVWTQVCGGSKIILEYANHFSALGHQITLVSYDTKPDWFPLQDGIQFIQVPTNQNIASGIPECDIIVITSWKCIYDVIRANIAPSVFFEQGGAHLLDVPNLTTEKKELIANRFNLVPFIYTVSSYAAQKIQEEYHRDSSIIPIAIDKTIFYPRDTISSANDTISITAIGSEDFKFKNIDTILQAYRILKTLYPSIHLNWITQTEPKKNAEPAIINPKQIVIGDILRKTDIYICASAFESFGLPILEAMTCGATVITSDTGGNRDFAINNENSLVLSSISAQEIVEKCKFLIDHPEIRMQLANKAMQTASFYSWENSVNQCLDYFKNIATYQIKKRKTNP